MRRRGYRAFRVALAALLSLTVGAVTAVVIMLTGAGAFWLVFFGDDPWPSWAETLLVGAAYGAGTLVFVVTILANLRSRP